MSTKVNKAARLSSTIRLPKSTFPPRARPEDLAKYRVRCADELYQWQSRQRRVGSPRNADDDTFILHDGPPYANGDLHVGHAINKILKDIICRFQLLQGKRVEYVPGWDCHGLPIELKALQAHRKSKHALVHPSPIEVRRIARRLAERTVEEQKAQFRSWGVMADWENPYKTMDQDFELRQLFVFLALYSQGLISRQYKPVYWSPSTRTALAEAELEYRDDHESTAALVAIPIIAPEKVKSGQYQDLKAVIWTTTPWTLPANQAIAVRREMLYTIVDSARYGHLVIAKSRLDFVQSKLEGDDKLHVIKDDIPGSFFVDNGFTYTSLFDKHDIGRPICAAPFVTDTAGTGLVHCAPGHGMEDYNALRQQINQGTVKVKAPINDAGLFTFDAMPDNPQRLVDEPILGEGQQKVLDYLTRRNCLLSSYSYKHKYPYDWRSKKPIVIRATAQWFADVHSIKNKAVQSLKDVDFFPETGKSRLTSFLQHRNEWCISRQRSWGVPIPALYDAETGEAVMNEKTIALIMQVLRERGTDAWFSDAEGDPAWIHPSLLVTSTPDKFRRGKDTMDVWFDSGTSWAELMSGPNRSERALADLYIEGSDQHRGWFQSSLLTRIAYQTSLRKDSQPKAPYKVLVTHGFTLDGEGRKMSKSLGNVVSPMDIISGKFMGRTSDNGLGPDALRLWVASNDFTTDIVVSRQSVMSAHTLLHKLRTTFKLLLGALQDFDPATKTSVEQLPLSEKIALKRLYLTKRAVEEAYSKYAFHQGVGSLSHYISHDLSSVYLESVKDRLYCESVSSPERRSAQTALYHILENLQALIAPICPLLIEETWTHATPKLKKSMTRPHEATYFKKASSDDPLLPIHDFEEHWDTLMRLNSAIKSLQEKARTDKKMTSSTQSSVKIIFHPVGSSTTDSNTTNTNNTNNNDDTTSSYPTLTKLQPFLPILSDFFVVSSITFATSPYPPPTSPPPESPSSSSPPTAAFLYTTPTPLPLPDSSTATIQISPPIGSKCDRCWRHIVDSSTTTKVTPDAIKSAYQITPLSPNKNDGGKTGEAEQHDGATTMTTTTTTTTTPNLCSRCVSVLEESITTTAAAAATAA